MSISAVLVLAVGFIIGLLWILNHSLPSASEKEEPIPSKQPPPEEQPPVVKSSTEAVGDRILANYASETSTGQDDTRLFHNYLSNVFFLIKSQVTRQYSLNEVLSAFIRGKNNYKTAYISEDSRIFDEKKMIVDRWGTPIHIHTVSSKVFELCFTGEDMKLYTVDDPVWPLPDSKRK
ncbi:hypothetical protein N9139_00190 [Akkermansiaceae bacterium]|nr:hypothetical protein [Akkermansiaceae bacterium]